MLNEHLVAIGNAVRHAPHSQKESIYRTACKELQISRATLLRKLNETTGRERRKQRSDAGSTSLSREEALVISGTLMESRRPDVTTSNCIVSGVRLRLCERTA